MDSVLSYHEAFVNLGKPIGVPADQVRYLASFFLAIPLASLYRVLPGIHTRHIFSAIFGLFFGYYCFGWQVLNCVISVTMTYILMRFLARSKFMPYIIFVFALGYMAARYNSP